MAVALMMVNAETSMALQNTITFFSEISGVLVDAEGAPQGGVRIVRSWKRTPEDVPMVDETVTSPNGTFSFPAATGRSRMAGLLPGTPVIRQEITAFGPNGPVTLWKTVKTNFDPNGELDGRPLNLECRIDRDPDGDGPVWGTCREAVGSFAPAVAGGDEELKLTWQWPAERLMETEILVRLEQVKPESRGFLGIRNSPSLGGSLPDPYELTGTVVHGPEAFREKLITLRVPEAEVKGLTAGGIAALGLIEEGRVCISITPATPGSFME